MRTISLNQISPSVNNQNLTQTTRELALQSVAKRVPATSHPSQSVSNNQAVSPCGALRSGKGKSEERARVRVSGETHAAKCESYALVFAKSELGLVSYDDYKFIPLPSVGYDPFETALDLRMILLSSLCCLKGCVLPFETKIAHKSRYRSLKFSEFNAKSVFSPALAFFVCRLKFHKRKSVAKAACIAIFGICGFIAALFYDKGKR